MKQKASRAVGGRLVQAGRPLPTCVLIGARGVRWKRFRWVCVGCHNCYASHPDRRTLQLHHNRSDTQAETKRSASCRLCMCVHYCVYLWQSNFHLEKSHVKHGNKSIADNILLTSPMYTLFVKGKLYTGRNTEQILLAPQWSQPM